MHRMDLWEQLEPFLSFIYWEKLVTRKIEERDWEQDQHLQIKGL